MRRLFLAINLPSETKKDLVKIQELLSIRLAPKAVKWVEKKNLHLSLAFLGYVSSKKEKEVKKVLSKIKFKSFSLQLSELGFFPHKNKPRIIWLGLKGERKSLKALYQKIVLVLTGQGFSFERRFVAHLTLGRVRPKYQVIFAKNKKIDQIIKMSKKFFVQNFDLMESILNPKGPKYDILKEF